MRIGIDMRMAGTGEGIGRYVEELVKHLSSIDFRNSYFLLFLKNSAAKFQIPKPKFQKVSIESSYYSWAEQTKLIWELEKLKLDLVHFANFNFPIFYQGKFVTTIHDLIHHRFPGNKKSRLVHRLAYRLTIRAAVKKASRIITVSHGTKAELVKTFGLKPDKTTVIYEGISESFYWRLREPEVQEVLSKYNIKKPYLLFVGVWRQYKNLPRLAQAFDILKESYHKDYQLVLAGKIDPFYPEIKEAVFSIKNKQDIVAPGFVSDRDLIAMYQGADAFVLPSLVEGFGLIGIEAQATGLPVVASDISVLREVLGDGAWYFNPRDEREIAEKIKEVLADEALRQQLIASGKLNATKYSWDVAARKTLEIYKSV